MLRSASREDIVQLEKAPDARQTAQYSTFFVAGRLFGLDVTCVQEVVKAMPMTRVPLAPRHIAGLINLRGQVAAAVGLRELFKLESRDVRDMMNVVCRAEGMLLSFLVDEIGDVVEVQRGEAERAPATVPETTRRFLSAVYQTSGQLLSVIDIVPICRQLGVSADGAA